MPIARPVSMEKRFIAFRDRSIAEGGPYTLRFARIFADSFGVRFYGLTTFTHFSLVLIFSMYETLLLVVTYGYSESTMFYSLFLASWFDRLRFKKQIILSRLFLRTEWPNGAITR